MDEGFPRRSRQIFAEILDVLIKNLMKYDAITPARTAFIACEYSF